MTDKHKDVVDKLTPPPKKQPFQLIIDINTKLHIGIPEFSAKIKCELTGIKQDDYLITTLPLLYDSSFVDKCSNSDGIEIICRYIYKGIAYGFKSDILGIITTPIQIMVIDYPKSAEVCNLRRYKRHHVLLICKVMFNSRTFYASILDINEKGCQLAILKSSLDHSTIQMMLYPSPDNVCVIVKLPGSKENVQLQGVKKNYRIESDEISLGIKFKDLCQESENLLRKFTSSLG